MTACSIFRRVALAALAGVVAIGAAMAETRTVEASSAIVVSAATADDPHTIGPAAPAAASPDQAPAPFYGAAAYGPSTTAAPQGSMTGPAAASAGSGWRSLLSSLVQMGGAAAR